MESPLLLIIAYIISLEVMSMVTLMMENASFFPARGFRAGSSHSGCSSCPWLPAGDDSFLYWRNTVGFKLSLKLKRYWLSIIWNSKVSSTGMLWDLFGLVWTLCRWNASVEWLPELDRRYICWPCNNSFSNMRMRLWLLNMVVAWIESFSWSLAKVTGIVNGIDADLYNQKRITLDVSLQSQIFQVAITNELFKNVLVYTCSRWCSLFGIVSFDVKKVLM